MKKSYSKNYPRLKFQLNKELDKKMCLYFLDRKAGGIDFGAGIMQAHPALKKTGTLNVEEKESFVSNYVDSFYQKYKHLVIKSLNKYKIEWQSVGDEFYKKTNEVFSGYPWPKGLYICYLSIFNCNPRFLENKTFQAFYRHPSGIKHIACHEMLHFMFYDYMEKKFAKEIQHISSDTLWELSEVFNAIILATPGFIKLTQTKPPMYPHLIKLTQRLSLIWDKTQKVDLFLQYCFQPHHMDMKTDTARDLQSILRFLHRAEKLKRELRHSWLSDGRRESVAEHTWRMALMAILLYPYLEDLDIEKTLMMVVCHDLVEIEVGDMPRPFKPDKKKKYQAELNAIKKIALSLPPEIGKNIQNLWIEFETADTPEAKFAQILDKLEVHMQHIEAPLNTLDAKLGEYALALHGADQEADKTPVTRLLNQLLYEEAKNKIKNAGFSVKKFEKQWERLKDKL